MKVHRLRVGLIAVLLVLAVIASACLSFQNPDNAPSGTASSNAIRAAFYYPWQPETSWPGGTPPTCPTTPAPTTNFNSAFGCYSSNDEPTVKTHIAQMMGAYTCMGISEWDGPNGATGAGNTDKHWPTLINAARNQAASSNCPDKDGNPTKFGWAPYYVDEGARGYRGTGVNPTSAQIVSDLEYIYNTYNEVSTSNLSSGLAFISGDTGGMVVFVYTDGNDSCDVVDRWAAAKSQFDQDTGTSIYINMKVFNGYGTCAQDDLIDAWHQYGPASREQDFSHPAGNAASADGSFNISPSFWKYGEATPRLTSAITNSGDDTAWKQAIVDMVNSGAAWQLITSWNEWGEGSAIEAYSSLRATAPSGFLTSSHAGFSISKYVATLVSYPPHTTATPPSTTTSSSTTTTAPASGYCGNSGSNSIDTVVVISFENKTWSSIGGVGFSSGAAPYLYGLAHGSNNCAYFNTWNETDTTTNSASQYVGLWTGLDGTTTSVYNDCSPGPGCQWTGDHLFKTFRAASVPHREYVEGATQPCTVGNGNAAKHIPELYMKAPADVSACGAEVRPLGELNWSAPPTGFSFITPTLCNDAHDCSFATFDSWLNGGRLNALLNSSAYQSGKVLVEIWGDEDRPVPNLFLCKYACSGAKSVTNVGHGSASKLYQELLIGSVPLTQGQIGTAPSIKSTLGL